MSVAWPTKLTLVIPTPAITQKMRYGVEMLLRTGHLSNPGSIPFRYHLAGGGLHLWAGYKFGTVSVFSRGVGIP